MPSLAAERSFRLSLLLHVNGHKEVASQAFRGDLRTLSIYHLTQELRIWLHELDAEHMEAGCALGRPALRGG